MFALIGKSRNKKGRTYIPVKAACKLSGYNQQYLRRLLRQEKLGGIYVVGYLIEYYLSSVSHSFIFFDKDFKAGLCENLNPMA
jgi:hypothetical protein